MELKEVRLVDPAVVPLLAGLAQEYLDRYGEGDEMKRAPAHEFDPPSGRFFVLLDGAEAVAGGGFRFHQEGVCEVKRMWTHPDYRRRGLAARVLDRLEDEARAAGYRRLVLETGPNQPEAASLYRGRGYEPISPFGPYPQALAFATDLVTRQN